MKEEKMIYNTYLNSLRWYALCDGITSLDKYRHNISSMQFCLPLSSMCEAVAGCTINQEFATHYDNMEEDILGL